MSFSYKTHQKKALKLPNEIDLKNKIFSFKDQLYLLSNKDFISRNYQKLQQIKENSSKTKLKFSSYNNNINLSFKIKTPNKSNKRMVIQNDLININSYKSKNIIGNNENNKLFFSLPLGNENNEIKKLNKAKSLSNLRNINIVAKNNKSENKYKLIDINNHISKIRNNKKITKHPLLNEFSKIKKIYLNITTKHKSVNFSRNSSINSSQSKNNFNKNKEKYKKINKEKKNDFLLIRNGLKKFFFNKYINNRLNKSYSREKRNKSLNIFNDLYDKIIQQSKEKNRLFLRLKKFNKSKDFSFSYHKNRNTKKNNISSKDYNDLMTSGSIDQKSEENYLEINPEEIHFKAVKYYQEIKINNFT